MREQLVGEEMTTDYARRVGDRLRNVRKQQRLSLQAVEASSEAEFKASVLGAYERGERAISVPRLQRLARFYNVPVDQLLPRDEGSPPPAWEGDAEEGFSGIEDYRLVLDLTRLETVPLPERELLGRFLRAIQVRRQDFNGRVLTIRAEDLRLIALLFDMRPEMMGRRLEELGVCQ